MDQFVRSQNVARYRRLLERVSEESDRQTIIKLLVDASGTGTTQSAQMSIVNLRAAFVDHPALISHELIQPPATEPTVAITYTVTIGRPIVLRSTLNRSCMNGENQNR